VACIVLKTCQTPMVGFTYCPMSSLYFIWNEQVIRVESHCHHLKNDEVILIHVSQDIFITWRWDQIITTWRRAIWKAQGWHLSKHEIKIRGINENKSKRRMKTFSLYSTHTSFNLHSRVQPTLHQNLPFWADFQLDHFTYTKNMSLKQDL